MKALEFDLGFIESSFVIMIDELKLEVCAIQLSIVLGIIDGLIDGINNRTESSIRDTMYKEYEQSSFFLILIGRCFDANDLLYYTIMCETKGYVICVTKGLDLSNNLIYYMMRRLGTSGGF